MEYNWIVHLQMVEMINIIYSFPQEKEYIKEEGRPNDKFSVPLVPGEAPQLGKEQPCYESKWTQGFLGHRCPVLAAGCRRGAT